jgi:DNA-binding HxlR family transcriptional regulator
MAQGGAVDGNEGAALADAAERVGDRWTLQVLHVLLGGPRRFGELQASIPGIATNVLSQRLRTLEAEGLVLAEPYQRRPVRHRYGLTGRGRDLTGVLRLLAAWSGGEGHAPHHRACGTALEARWWCPTCATPTEPTDDDLTWV